MAKHTGRLLVLVLALNIIMAGGIAAPAWGATQGVADGFEVTETGTIDIIGAATTTYTHVKTGARVMHIANDDAERAFVVSFETPALDNKGVPHVFEHMTLGGSESYPSTALFFSVIYQTYNTGINANTFNSMTDYYYSTMSEDQLLLIADFYLDSAFHPLMYRDNMAFLREACAMSWRTRTRP
jgi:Zn-dependent M16 (insulinase) family peptidase